MAPSFQAVDEPYQPVDDQSLSAASNRARASRVEWPRSRTPPMASHPNRPAIGSRVLAQAGHLEGGFLRCARRHRIDRPFAVEECSYALRRTIGLSRADTDRSVLPQAVRPRHHEETSSPTDVVLRSAGPPAPPVGLGFSCSTGSRNGAARRNSPATTETRRLVALSRTTARRRGAQTTTSRRWPAPPTVIDLYASWAAAVADAVGGA